jgi:hypothetical protein
MNPRVYFFVKAVSDFYRSQRYISKPSILEIGSRQMFGQESYADFRSLFSGSPYLGIDLIDGQGVDYVCDFSALINVDQFINYDIIICTEVLEHIKDLDRFCHNLEKCISRNTLLVLTVPFFVEIHGSPCDYWRFSQEGLHEILSFIQIEVMPIGLPRTPLTYVCLGRNKQTIFENSDIQQIFTLYRHLIRSQLRYYSFINFSGRVYRMILSCMPGIFEPSIRTKVYRSYIINHRLSLRDIIRLILPPKVVNCLVSITTRMIIQ